MNFAASTRAAIFLNVVRTMYRHGCHANLSNERSSSDGAKRVSDSHTQKSSTNNREKTNTYSQWRAFSLPPTERKTFWKKANPERERGRQNRITVQQEGQKKHKKSNSQSNATPSCVKNTRRVVALFALLVALNVAILAQSVDIHPLGDARRREQLAVVKAAGVGDPARARERKVLLPIVDGALLHRRAHLRER